jgi:hypothetical protein
MKMPAETPRGTEPFLGLCVMVRIKLNFGLFICLGYALDGVHCTRAPHSCGLLCVVRVCTQLRLFVFYAPTSAGRA